MTQDLAIETRRAGQALQVHSTAATGDLALVLAISAELVAVFAPLTVLAYQRHA